MDFFNPVPGSRLSSPFGLRSSPGGIGSTNHKGMDFAAPFGTSVLSPVGGSVLYSGPAKGYGSNFVRVLGDDGNTYDFGHMSNSNVSKGMRVASGTLIGAVGSEGNSTGNHLHLGVKDAAGKFVNPANVLSRVQGKGRKVLNNVLGETAGNAISDVLLGTGGKLSGGSAIAQAGIEAAIPGSSLVFGALGVGNSQSWIDALKQWILDSGIFQRIALAILAFIMLLAAFYLMKEKD